MSVGTDDLPYRAPCDGIYRAPRYAVGSCYQHKRATERSIPVFNNNTVKTNDDTVVNGTGCEDIKDTCPGGTIIDHNCFVAAVAPTGVFTNADGYAIGVGTITLKNSGSGVIEPGFTIQFPDDPTIYTAVGLVNLPGGVMTFAPDLVKEIPAAETAVTVTAVHDMSLCHKQGWKAVRARKCWHGMYGFTATPSGMASPCLDGDSNPVCAEVVTKYLTVRRTVNGSFTTKDDVPEPDTGTWSYSLAVAQTTSVNADTGIVTRSEYSYDWHSDDGGEAHDTNHNQLLGTGSNALMGCGKFNIPELDFGVAELGEDGWPVAGYTPNFEPWGLPGWWVTEIIFTNTHVQFSLHCNAPSGLHEPSIWGTVTVDIQLSDINGFNENYELACELLGEWQLNDDIRYPWRLDTTCGVVPLVAVREKTPTSPDIGNTCVWPETDCEWTDPDAAFYNGETTGQPLPAWQVYNTTGQESAFYQCMWSNSFGPLSPQWAPTTLVPAATWWMSGTGFTDGAFSIMKNDVIYVQKWAVIKDSHPSINFFRPCGVDRDTVSPDFSDAWPICGHVAVSGSEESGGTVTVGIEEAPYLRVGDWVRFVKYDAAFARTELGDAVQVTAVDTGEFEYSGSVPDATATHVISYNKTLETNAPHYKWHNDTAKGDYTFHQWTRTYAADCTTDEAYTCTEGCILRTPCAPSVICISPNVENFENGMVHTFAEATPGQFWRAIALADNWDPFGGGFRTESRKQVPTGAPTLHAGVALPCSAGDCGAPAEDSTCYDPQMWV